MTVEDGLSHSRPDGAHAFRKWAWARGRRGENALFQFSLFICDAIIGNTHYYTRNTLIRRAMRL